MDVEQSPSIAGLAAALVAAQTDLRNPVRDSINPFFKSRYADLATVRDAVVPVLARHGLAVVQMPSTLNGAPALASTLCHQSGEWIRSSMLLCAAKTDPQGIGSALTYARRYALQAIAGVAAEDDDDGNAASHPPRRFGPGKVAIMGTPRPAAAPAPAAPARPTDAEMKETMQAKGWGWAAVVREINRHENQNYPLVAKPDDIRPAFLANFFRWLADQPSAAKVPA